MKTRSLFVMLLIACLFVSCKPAQKIVYNTANLEPYPESVSVSISIQPFEDIRSESEINQALMQAKDIEQKINGQKSCINAEKLYKIPVGLQMADIFASHLTHKNYFSSVLVNQKENTDYYITAKIKHFYGVQKFSNKAVVGASFGLIGALATSNLKTDATIIIELSDICLYDKNNNQLAKVGDFKKEYTGEFPVDAHCYCIYQNINQKLMEFNEDLGKTLFLELKKQK